jgi:hypothetical protein
MRVRLDRLAAVPLMMVATAAGAANEPPDGVGGLVFPATSFLTTREAFMAFAVLGFGIVMALVAVYLVRSKLMRSADTLRLVALILIVTGTLFLVAAGYSAQEIAPALGLLGTVAGYLLGRAEQRGERGDGADARRD